MAGDVHDPESFKPMLQLVRGMEDDTLIQMMMEMIVWRRYYDPRVSGQGESNNIYSVYPSSLDDYIIVFMYRYTDTH